MKMNRIGKIGGALLLALAFQVVSTVSAEAAPMRAWFCDDAGCVGGGDIAAIDNGFGDSDGALGSILIFPGIEIATSYPAVGSPAQPYLNLTYILTGLGSGGTRFLYAMQDGFTYTGGLGFKANATSGTGVATVFADTGLFGGPPGAAGDIVCGPAVLDTACVFGAPAPTYYLAMKLDVKANAFGVASGDGTIVPEPASMTLFGMGLLGVGLVLRRRKQQIG